MRGAKPASRRDAADPYGVGRRREAPEASPRTECGSVQTEGKRFKEAGCARNRRAGRVKRYPYFPLPENMDAIVYHPTPRRTFYG